MKLFRSPVRMMKALLRPLYHIAADVGARLSLLARWHFTKGTTRPLHKLKGHLVVSLTSFPPRYATLHLTLRSLLLQSRRPDVLVLWIAHAHYSSLPSKVLDLQAHGLIIRSCDDLRSYKKSVPTLLSYPESFLCTADDDLYYFPSWLNELAEGYANDGQVVCHRAHHIARSAHGAMAPYSHWAMNTEPGAAHADIFPTTGHGVIYPPGALDALAVDADVFNALCPNADDVWFYFMARLQGTEARKVGRRRSFRPWIGSQTVSLYATNVLPGTGNDAQIARMGARFGWP